MSHSHVMTLVSNKPYPVDSESLWMRELYR